MEEETFRLEDFFDIGSCEACGTCLYRCPTLGLNQKEAKEEIERLIAGEPARRVFRRCASCYSCDTWCPHDCHPYGLILYRWYERYLRRGMPVRALLAMPLEDFNFTHIARENYTPREREMVGEWERNAADEVRIRESEGEVLFAGCNARIFPALLDTSVIGDLPIIGGQELCCAEMYYRVGVFPPVRRQMRALEERYRRLGVRKMIFFCAACYNMLTNVLPVRFGADFSFETEYLGDWLHRRIERGELSLSPLEPKKVTIQEPCHAKVLGREFMDIPRRLLKEMGQGVVEMKYSKEYSICCGAACGARGFNPLDMGAQAMEEWRMARRSGADALVAYCATCLLMLHIGKMFRPTSMPLYHLMELIMQAVGEETPHDLIQRRARYLALHILAKGFPRMLSPKRVKA